MDIEHRISIKASLRRGWDLWKQNWLFLTLFFLVTLILTFMLSLPTEEVTAVRYALLLLVTTIVGLFVKIATLTICLNIERGETPQFKDIFSKFHRFPTYLLAMILFGIGYFVGIMLLIVPGIIFGVMFCLMPLYILDKDMKAIEAFKASKTATYGFKWKLFFFVLIALALNLLGILCFGVGVLITLPVSYLAFVDIYLKLSQEEIILLKKES